MIINALLLLLAHLLDIVFGYVLMTHFSYQSPVLTTFFALNLWVLFSFDMERKERWISGMIYALLLEIQMFDSYLFSFLIMGALILLVDYFQSGIGESAPIKIILSMIVVFLFMSLNYGFHLALGQISFSWGTFFRIELLPNMLLNMVVIGISLWLNNQKLKYLERKDHSQRLQEKSFMYEGEDL